MKILLVQSYLGRKNPEIPMFPIGLSYIADYLKGHDVRIIDMNLCDDPYNDFAGEVREIRPDVVGISLRNIDSVTKRNIFYYFETLQPTVGLVKEIDQNIKIAVGGPGYSIYAREIMERVREIDFGIYLEGEESFPELLDNLNSPANVKGLFYREGEEVLFTGQRELLDFKSMPMPSRELFDVKQYTLTRTPTIGIQTKRGCPLKCSYCTYPLLVGRQVRVRTTESVVDEIEYLVDKFKIKRFMIVDSVFNIPKNHAEEFCKEIIRRNLKIQWTAYFELGTFTDELLMLAKEAGCYLFGFAPDAVSDESLKAMGKTFKEEDIYKTLRMARKVKGVLFFFEFFCTPPKQDFLGFLKTLKMYFIIHFYLFNKGGANLSWIRVEPNTPIHKTAIEEGILKEGDTLLPNDEKGLINCFYSCPTTRWYADPVFNFICYAKEKARFLFTRKAPEV